MSPLASRTAYGSEAYKAGAAMLFVAAGTILGALAFEHIGGYIPCPLCLQQRYAYYAGVPLLFAALVLIGAELKQWATLIFLAVAFMFLANAGLGIYQSGAEWKFWPGPTTCGTQQSITSTAADMLKRLETTQPIRCDEASWRFLGLSFAGWNVVISAFLFGGCLKAAAASASKGE